MKLKTNLHHGTYPSRSAGASPRQTRKDEPLVLTPLMIFYLEQWLLAEGGPGLRPWLGPRRTSLRGPEVAQTGNGRSQQASLDHRPQEQNRRK